MKEEKKIDILFVIPPYHHRNGSGFFFPLGISSIIACLEMRNLTWDYIDCVEIVRTLTNNSLKQLGIKLEDKLKKYHPQIVGIGPCVTPGARALKVVSDCCVNAFGVDNVFAGGPFVNLPSQDWFFYEYLGLKYLIKGEGEIAVCEAVETIKSGQGLDRCREVSKHNHEYMNYIENLDDLPFPRRVQIEKNKLSDRRKSDNKRDIVAQIVASRGCPYKCTYCVSGNMKAVSFRKRSAKNIISEIKMLVEQYGVTDIVFYDDCFFTGKNTIHKEYLSEQKFNYSFHSINLSHSKQKKLKLEKSEKNIKYQLFHQFSTTFQKKSSINLGLKKDKENFDSYHKNLEKILSKARNHKTISVQKLKTKIKKKIKEKEREKINEKVEIELDEIADKTNNNTIKSSSNSSNKINNNISKSSNKNILNKSPNHKRNKNHNIVINIKIKKDQTKEIKLYDNGKYEGIIINGKREKTGIMEYNDGTKYEGEWNNDKKHGKGILTVDQTNNNHNLILIKYIGDFVNNKKEGKGIAIYSNGDKYEGEWKNNQQYGRGIVTYSSGGRYEGDWSEGKFNGLGTYFLRNGERYEGKFEDNRYNGYGKFYHINGDILEGIFINDQPNGKCFLYKSDGTVEEHDF